MLGFKGLAPKVEIKAFAITQPRQKLFFQMKLPMDANRIIAVEASARTVALEVPVFAYSTSSPLAGGLKVHANGTSDIIYAGGVSFTENISYHQSLELGYEGVFDKGWFWQEGTKHASQDISYPVESRVLSCLYEDKAGFWEGAEYRIKVYIHYETALI